MAISAPVAPSTRMRIVEAATNQFFELGYHGASMKELADEAGVRSATLYYHFPSKEKMLVEIMRTTLEELTAVVGATVVAHDAPEAALRAAVTSHIQFHVDHRRAVFLCDAELRALSPEVRVEIVGLRDRYEEMFRSMLRSARDARVLEVPDVELVTRSLLASCSAVAFWFRERGAMKLDDVADAYANLFLRALRI